MKKTPLMLLAVVLAIGFSGFSGQKALPNPPGTFQLSKNFYADETPLNHIHWLEFLDNLKQDSSEAVYQAMLPDTLQNPLWPEVLRSKKHYRVPLTGISKHQAESYCHWRSEYVTQAKDTRGKSVCRPGGNCEGAIALFKRFEKADPDNRFKIVYRLPTLQEQQQLRQAITRGKVKSAAPAIPGNPASFTIVAANSDNELWNIAELTADAAASGQPMGFRCVAAFESRSSR